ncbi:MAG: AAA family ATPase [bacterium]|nr:AAA family ATPase [bacterium]
MELKPNITTKYCQAIDRFIKIRAFSAKEAQEILKDVTLTNRRSYVQLIINSAIVNYNDEIMKEVFLSGEFRGKDMDLLEENLYGMCISVTPELDINKVSITTNDTELAENIFLLEGRRSSDKGSCMERIEGILKKRIVGQAEAISKVVRVLKSSYTGIRRPEKPAGVFLFAGQTGVGKTELAKAIADLVLGSQSKMIRIDCSEYALPHEYAKLIGAPPGYIGYEDGGVLTGAARAEKDSVFLFDEIEKAHPKVHNLLLQIMDEGFATDNKGQRIPFGKSIIIMTSNVGAGEIAEMESSIGFGNRIAESTDSLKERETVKALEDRFAPEFLNRLDDIIVFRALDHEDNTRIVDMFLGEVSSRMASIGKKLSFPKSVRDHLAAKIETSKYGARPLKRIISRYIEAPLSDCLLTCRFKEADKIRVTMKKGKINFIPS